SEKAFDLAKSLAVRTSGRIRRTGDADLVSVFCAGLSIQVMARVLGLPAEDTDLLRPWASAGMAYVSDHRQDPATLRRGLDARDDLYAYLAPQISRRRTDPGDDLLSVLCTTPVDGRLLTDDEVSGSCALLLAAGADTAGKGLALFLSNLVDHPDVLAELHADPSLIDAAWAESLRRDPPTHMVLRQTTEAVDLPSGRVPAGATVACILASANRDPRQFAEPDRFDIHRLTNVDREFAASAGHVAFGAGRHFCLGAHLARLLGRTVPVLLAELPGLRWSDGFTPVSTGLISRAPKELRVTADVRETVMYRHRGREA
ncbi:cytochrome P450, partial [Lentzea jiangxiensis]